MVGTSTGPLVELRGVEKHFGMLHVLKHIDLAVDTGEVVVVVGPSGSGKSTLCRTINRLETIDGGTITLDGQPLPDEGRALARLRADVGMVFQQFNLFAHKTVLENVTLGQVKVKKTKPAQARETAIALLERVGVADQRDKLPAQLSGGQQQRVAIARALVTRPALLLADEPTGNLDTRTAETIFELFRRFNVRFGCAVLVVTHDPRLAAGCPRTVELVDGRIVRDGAGIG